MLIVISDCADRPISGDREYFDKGLNANDHLIDREHTFRKAHGVAEHITKHKENEQNIILSHYS